MPTVFNWQLGREMRCPYAQASPKEQFAFVININGCIGRRTCTMACKSTWTFAKGQERMWWTNVETKPYGGYPQTGTSKSWTSSSTPIPVGRSGMAARTATAEGICRAR